MSKLTEEQKELVRDYATLAGAIVGLTILGKNVTKEQLEFEELAKQLGLNDGN